MKNTMKKALSLLLALGITLSLAACAAGGEKESEPVLMVPATQPDYSDETLAPIYTRPQENEESGDISVENPEGGDVIEPEDPEYDPEADPNGEGESGGGSSSGGASADTDTGDTFADGSVSSNMQGSAKNLNWTNINSFKIKSSSMSVAEMRKLCVDFFRFAKTALWTPDESISYIRNSNGVKDSMQGGSLYGGLPYVGLASGNIYRLMDYLDTNNGKVDMADALNLSGGTMDMAVLKYFGNQCANGAFTGWGRVINSVTHHYTAGMTKKNGYLPVGNYQYDFSISSWSNKDGKRTTDVVQANGEQVMFESYALLKMGDGLVYYTSAGHVIMAATDAVVVRNADGTINGNDSYITIIDQAQSWESQTSGGKTFQYKSSVDAKVSFKKLFSSNYLPFTFAEFQGTDPVESTSVSISVNGASVTLAQLYKATVTGNYAVSDAYIIVKDASGKEAFKHAVRNSSNWGKTLKMAATGANVDFWGTAPTSGSYTVEVVAQLSTGERPTIYSGQLAF